MAFFNKKEDVMHFELTPYGRYLLSQGEFDPAYYEFCDEEIIYDNDCANVSEELKDAQNRLKNEFVKMKETVNVLSCDVAKSKDYSSIDYINNHSSIGTSKVASKYAPSWTMNVLNGEIESVVQAPTDGTLKFTQLEMTTSSFEIIPTKDENEYTSDETVSDIFGDDTFLKVYDEYLFLELKEENTEDFMYNFEFELYEIEYDSNGKEVLSQFSPVDDKFFELLVDEEIEPEFYCEHRSGDQADNFYTKQREKCIVKKPGRAVRPYDNIIQKDTEEC